MNRRKGQVTDSVGEKELRIGLRGCNGGLDLGSGDQKLRQWWRYSEMNLKRRINKLESQITAPEDLEAEVEYWAVLWAEARQGDDGHILDEDRDAALQFLSACRGLGETPSIVAMLRLSAEDLSEN